MAGLPIVFVPGLLCTGRIYEHQVQQLGRRHPVLLADHWSHTSMTDIAKAIFAVAPEKQEDPSFADIDRYRREALLKAVERAVPDWDGEDRKAVAAALDIFWNPPLYERLVEEWGLNADRAVGLISWLVTLIEQAVQAGERPGVRE